MLQTTIEQEGKELSASLLNTEINLVKDLAVCGDETTSSLEGFLEKMLVWFCEKHGDQQFAPAKEEYYWKAGKIFPDDQIFNTRMEYFIDYFLFQRPIDLQLPKAAEVTPYSAYVTTNVKLSADSTISDYRHSIFEIIKIKGGEMVVRDLLSDKKLFLQLRKQVPIFESMQKEIFQGFIYHYNNALTPSRGLVFHPQKTSKIIKKYIHSAKVTLNFDEEKILFCLARKQLKHYRHQNINPKVIYSSDHG